MAFSNQKAFMRICVYTPIKGDHATGQNNWQAEAAEQLLTWPIALNSHQRAAEEAQSQAP